VTENTEAKSELYFSMDIEADGPYPLDYSMLSLGVTALLPDGTELSTFEVNFEQLPGAREHPATMEWWEQFPEAWEYCRQDLKSPSDGMEEFVTWVENTCGNRYKPVAVAMPSTFDYMFVYIYMMKFAGRAPFSFSCIDMKSVAMTLLKKKSFRRSGKQNWPKRWFTDLPHTHKAIDDAREQGQSFIRMLKEVQGK